MADPEIKKCELCGKRLKKEDCYEYEQYNCLCFDCKEQEEQEDDFLFI